MTKSTKYFLLLGLAQALHSIEEIYFHLYDFAFKVSMPVPPIISDFAHLRMKSEIFAIMNIIIIMMILISVLYYESRRCWAIAAAWIWAVVEILNGLGHLAATIIFSQYFPGALSAPLLLLLGSMLFYQLIIARRHV